MRGLGDLGDVRDDGVGQQVAAVDIRRRFPVEQDVCHLLVVPGLHRGQEVDHVLVQAGRRQRPHGLRRAGDDVAGWMVHVDRVGRIREQPLEGHVVRARRPLEGADANQVADERRLQDPHVRLADLLMEQAVVGGGRRRRVHVLDPVLPVSDASGMGGSVQEVGVMVPLLICVVSCISMLRIAFVCTSIFERASAPGASVRMRASSAIE